MGCNSPSRLNSTLNETFTNVKFSLDKSVGKGKCLLMFRVFGFWCSGSSNLNIRKKGFRLEIHNNYNDQSYLHDT